MKTTLPTPRTLRVWLGLALTVTGLLALIQPTANAQSSACDITAFGLQGNWAVIDGLNITLPMPPGTTEAEVAALDPVCITSTYATIRRADPLSINHAATYTIVAEDDSTQQNYAVHVIVGSAPPNDNFAAAIGWTGDSGTQTGTTNRYATAESGEPETANNTVWFKWTCGKNGELTVSTLGSRDTNNDEWDAVLGIYTGTAVNELTAPPGSPQDDDYAESMTVPVSAGTTYYIQLDGSTYDGLHVATNIVLKWSFVRSVIPGQSKFDAWIDGLSWDGFTDPDISATGDPDRDGKTNAQEYAFGLEPNSGASCNPITVQLNKATGTFIYTRRATPPSTGITYTVLTSASPAAAENEWTPDTGATEGATTTVGDVQTVPITLSDSLLSAPRLFVRVKAVLPP